MRASIALLSGFVLLADARLVVTVCCGNPTACRNFTKVEDVMGVTCCGDVPMNQVSQICCDEVVRERRRGSLYLEGCCGNQTYSYDQTCCEGVVHNVRNAECCGTEWYTRDDGNVLCCNGSLAKTAGPGSVCCGEHAFDGGATQICCGQHVFSKRVYDSCCQTNDDDYLPYHSLTHSCCDGPLQRNSGRACCYLRRDEAIVPAQYNTTSECCRFPYTRIQEMFDGVCLAAPLARYPSR